MIRKRKLKGKSGSFSVIFGLQSNLIFSVAAKLRQIDGITAFDGNAFEAAAENLKKMIGAELPRVQVKIGKNLGLCSYCAEEGGLLVGYEKF